MNEANGLSYEGHGPTTRVHLDSGSDAVAEGGLLVKIGTKDTITIVTAALADSNAYHPGQLLVAMSGIEPDRKGLASSWVTVIGRKLFGNVGGVDTSGDSVGDLVWLSDANAGEYTTTRPTGAAIPVGRVRVSDATLGVIEINPAHMAASSRSVSVEPGVAGARAAYGIQTTSALMSVVADGDDLTAEYSISAQNQLTNTTTDTSGQAVIATYAD